MHSSVIIVELLIQTKIASLSALYKSKYIYIEIVEVNMFSRQDTHAMLSYVQINM